MRERLTSATLSVLLLLAAGTSLVHADQPVSDQAAALAQRLLIIDTHVDVPYRLQERWEDVTQATPHGDFDLPRARQGGLNAPFMSIYVPASLEQEGGGYELANRLIDHVEAMAARAPQQMALARKPSDLQDHQSQGRMSLVMGMENGTPIEGDLDKLHHFHDRGIRYITLAHSKSNHISDSSYDPVRQWDGLSDFGRQLVQEMNRIGVMIDISHLSDDAARQAITLSSVPVIASHSSVRAFTPDWERNMSDDLIKLMASKGGVIHINFGSSFLIQKAQQWYTDFDAARTAFMTDQAIERDDPAVETFTQSYRAENPFPFATVADVADHVDHVRDLVGVAHIGIGSDYDGVGDSLPVGLKSVADYPRLIDELLKREYSESDIEKILSSNLLRVWNAVEAAAQP